MELREYLAVVRKRWWVILLVAAVGGVSAFLFARLQPTIYRSSVLIEVYGRIDYGQTLATQSLLRQLAARINTDRYANEVERRRHFDLGAEKLRDNLHVQALMDTLQIEIQADDIDPVRAQQIALTFAQVFEEDQAARMSGVPQQERINVRMLDLPKPGTVHWPQSRLLGLAGAVIGLLVGTLLAFLLDYLDDTIKTMEDVERSLGLLTLGAIPTSRAAAVITRAQGRVLSRR